MVLHNQFGRDIAAERSVGPLWHHAQLQCTVPHGPIVSLPVYPGGSGLAMPLQGTICTPAVAAYIPPRVALPLAPLGNNYVGLTTATITQTFKADYGQLSGISLYFSTFGARRNTSMYRFELLDSTCQQTIRTTTFKAAAVADNTYFDIHFPAVNDAKGKMYCFKVTPASLQAGQPPLAVQLSAPNLYAAGIATKDQEVLPQDTVFDVLYR